MKQLNKLLLVLLLPALSYQCTNDSDGYDGTFCSGTGDIGYLRLIDESFAFFNPNPVVPNLTLSASYR